MKKLLLCLVLLTGCTEQKVGQCWISGEYNRGVKITEVDKYGVFGTKFEREPIINLNNKIDYKPGPVYMTFRLFHDMYFEPVDCKAYFKEDGSSK